uniref:Protein kinase domain-containing protein n=3 Tax=Caenorhabditis tropicalis TaxID=1561998 RepID=A0A1I7U6Q8_9PELO
MMITRDEEELKVVDGCIDQMSSIRISRLLFFALCIFSIYMCEQFCATDGINIPVVTDPNYMCNADNFSRIGNPPLQNESTFTNNCEVVFLLDLDSTYTTEENYTQVIQFISDATITCMNHGVGYAVFAYPMFNDTKDNTATCCNAGQCRNNFAFMNYRNFVGHYDNMDPVQMVSNQYNFSYVLIDDLKKVGTPQTACLYNNYVLITNRLFNISDNELVKEEIKIIKNTGCITLTIIAVGNPKIDTEMMFDAYFSIADSTYTIESFNCLDLLKNCIMPCGTEPSQECYAKTERVCAEPTTAEPTTTVATTPTPTTTFNPDYVNDWQITYLFAITNRTTQTQFNNLVKYISDPLEDCSGHPMIYRFLAKNNSNSGWMTDVNLVADYLQKNLKYDEVLIGADNNNTLFPGSDQVTYDLVYEAVSSAPTYNEDGSVRVPRVVLLTDYVSNEFVSQYNTSLLPLLELYDFNIIAFTEEAYDGYKSKLAMKSFQITNDEGFSDTKELKLCQKQGSNVTTIMFIIIGTCSGAMLILILLTVLYRQKYMWMRKLKRFKTSHVADIDDNDIIDHWELSWEKLVVKNEKLGHGAYGHVFKGKIIGVPPAIDKYNRAEALDFADCDCAVKMLPKYATDAAKQEFRHEIELMKNLGFNEHLVNMLGCITVSAKSCLVLEYCFHRDLLRYVKNKKCDLELSRSVDDTIDSHKEFLNFAWQVTQGMRFLVDKKIIHRDLAARNILITEQSGMKSAKVSDFGLAISSEPSENGEDTGSDRLPIKWLALECLEKAEFSHKSDVWSFGIVIFEMYSLGEVPFSDIEPTELISHLKSGARPKTPLLATDKIEEIMSVCWEEKPMKRPEFDELSTMFATQLEQTTEGYGYLELIKTRDYRVIAEAVKSPPDEQKSEIDAPICIDDHPPYVTRNRSVTWRSKPNGEAKLGREYSLTTHVCEDETHQTPPNGTPKLPPTTSEPPEKDRKEKKKSYLNLPNILPSFNSINPFSKENEFKKTFKKKKFYSRRGSVPY